MVLSARFLTARYLHRVRSDPSTKKGMAHATAKEPTGRISVQMFLLCVTIELYSVIDQGHMCVLLLIKAMCVMPQLISKESRMPFATKKCLVAPQMSRGNLLLPVKIVYRTERCTVVA